MEVLRAGAPHTRCWARGALACVVALLAPEALAQKATSPERALKAAFVLNFARFVELPAAAFEDEAEPFVLTILGEDPFGGALEKVLEGQTIRGRGIRVERVEAIEDVGRCHMVFLTEALAGKLPELLEKLGDRPVVTVSDAREFAERGGMFQLYPDGKRLRFKINTRAAESHKLKVSAKLLKLGDLIESLPQGRK